MGEGSIEIGQEDQGLRAASVLKEAVAEAANAKTSERDCKLLDVKVHFFKDKMAVLYGSETAIHPSAAMPDGKERTVKLTWVDTWLKRDGKWQIVAAEDMPSEAK